jgi:hypothetical protein
VALGLGIYGLNLESGVEENIDLHNVNYDPECQRFPVECRQDIDAINSDGQKAADFQDAALIVGVTGAALFATGTVLFFFSEMSPLAPAEGQGDVACAATAGGVSCRGSF